jgi:hypothetical protein
MVAQPSVDAAIETLISEKRILQNALRFVVPAFAAPSATEVSSRARLRNREAGRTLPEI